jgi:2-iminobutanoate/2-iminopropanoate deaminase
MRIAAESGGLLDTLVEGRYRSGQCLSDWFADRRFAAWHDGPDSMKTIVRPDQAAPPVGPYSHAVRVGNLLFCAGQIPLDPATGAMVTGDVRQQSQRVMENIKLILESEGLSFEHVVKTTVFLTDLNDFAGMNEVYARYFQRDYPARSTIQVAALPRGARVEIEVIAYA